MSPVPVEKPWEAHSAAQREGEKAGGHQGLPEVRSLPALSPQGQKLLSEAFEFLPFMQSFTPRSFINSSDNP